MKNNIKNLAAMGIVMAIFLFGTQAAYAGIMISDRSAAPTQQQQTCGQSEESLASRVGILISDFASSITGLFVSDRSGILVSDRSGILVSDRSGIMISDRAGETGCQESK